MKEVKQQYENNLEHQNKAVKAVIDSLQGINSSGGRFSLNNFLRQTTLNAASGEFGNSYHGIANQISQTNWFDEIVCDNIKSIQLENGISSDNISNQKIFDIEMETGTGKTYVFLKTIFELNKVYGFKKFIIVVPSIAIREGVKQELTKSEQYFKKLYNNINYRYYEYDGNRPETIHDFAQNNNIEIMILNVQKINKMKNEKNNSSNTNNIYKHNEKFGGDKPIQWIQKTQPILIIDEPQTTQSGNKNVDAIENINSLFILRYSATFKKNDRHNLLYRLSAFDAVEKKLVKEISTLSSKIIDDNSKFKLLKTDAKTLTCQIELYKDNKEKKITFKEGYDLYDATKNSRYKNNYIIDEIDFANNWVSFRNGEKLYIIDKDERYNEALKKDLIRNTIIEHLDKELLFHNKQGGIKVLSLFFLDKVSNYREYDEKTGEAKLGLYAKIFEEEFIKIASDKKYQKLFTNAKPNEIVSKIHDGYFSVDNKKQFKNTKGDTADDRKTYEKIMKDKGRLLSFDEPLKFIFSHSALNEGWDNPNVFQICILNDSGKSEMKKRQQIGRGLRLCVNQDGIRIKDPEVNKLTIITTESHQDFVDGLQKEYGNEFKKIERNTFVNIEGLEITREESDLIFDMLIKEGMLDKDTHQIKENSYNEEIFLKILEKKIPGRFNDEQKQILVNYMKKKIPVKDASKKKQINKLKKEILYSPEFQALWEKIKFKTIYKVKFDTDDFIKKTQTSIKNEIKIQDGNKKITIVDTKAKVDINRDGIETVDEKYIGKKEYEVSTHEEEIPDFVGEIEENTHLTKRTIAKILNDKQIINFIKNSNYDNVIKVLIKKIQENKLELMVKGIEYSKVENDYYELSQFEGEVEIAVYENEFDTDDKNKVDSFVKVSKENYEKYPYEFVQTDSIVEVDFAKDSLSSKNIKRFIKLPKSWFQISTPLGSYTPDWALYNDDSLVFVAETKGSTDTSNLRQIEQQKISCAEKHFDHLKSKNINIKFKTVKKLSEL